MKDIVVLEDMSVINNSAYKELEKSLGVFYPTIIMANNAREIAKSLDYRITDSVALDYAARGEIPDPKDYPDHRLDRVKDYISYIDDIEIKSAIISSYENSLKQDNLVYMYNTIQDVYRQSRVRVIMNILWDTRPHKDK